MSAPPRPAGSAAPAAPPPDIWLAGIAARLRAALADGAVRTADPAGHLVLRRRDGRLFTVAPGILAELAQAGLLPPLPEPVAEAEPAADPVEAAERAAVQAEPEPPPKGTPEYARWYSEHTLRALENARTVRGLLAAALQRPPYWPDTGSPPPQGAWCTTCRGSRWWRPTHPATDGTRTGPGWRCATCHPPDHLPKNQIVEAKT